jgi:hypothetical protein
MLAHHSGARVQRWYPKHERRQLWDGLWAQGVRRLQLLGAGPVNNVQHDG